MICQTKTIQISTYNKLSIARSINSPNFLSPKVQKESIQQTSPAKLSHYTEGYSEFLEKNASSQVLSCLSETNELQAPRYV